MISRQHRFRGYNSLRHVYKHGVTIRGPLFSLKVIKNPRRDSYRLAVVVARKINKSAVARNRIRRRLYEIVRANEGDILEAFDIVLTVFAESIIEESPQSLASQLKKQLSDAGVLVKRTPIHSGEKSDPGKS